MQGLALVFALTLIVGFLARERLLIGAARILTVDDAEGPADYLVVLGGSPDTRPFAAAELYRRGMAPRVVIFEYRVGRLNELGRAPSQTELYRRVLQLEGVPTAAIVEAPGLVRSSWDEAQSLRRFLAEAPAARVIIVTSAEHTRRARWVFRRALAGLGVDVKTAAARHLAFDDTNWWRNDEGVLLIVHEYLKLPFYLVRYGIADDVD